MLDIDAGFLNDIILPNFLVLKYMLSNDLHFASLRINLVFPYSTII
jgi:hypothetical protein